MIYEKARPSVSDSKQGWSSYTDADDKHRYQQIKSGYYEPLKNQITYEEIENTKSDREDEKEM